MARLLLTLAAFVGLALPALAQAPALAPATPPAEAAAAAAPPTPAADPFTGAVVNLDDFRGDGGSGFSSEKIAAWNAAHTEAERINIRNGCTLVRGAVGSGRYSDDLLGFCNTYVSLFWQVFIVATYVISAAVIAGFLIYTFASARRVRRRLAEMEARGIRRRSAAPAT